MTAPNLQSRGQTFRLVVIRRDDSEEILGNRLDIHDAKHFAKLMARSHLPNAVAYAVREEAERGVWRDRWVMKVW